MADIDFFATHNTFDSKNQFNVSYECVLGNGDYINTEITRFKTKPGFEMTVLKSVNLTTSLRSCSIARQHENTFSTIGFHPAYLDECKNNYNNFMFDCMRNIMITMIINNTDKIIAIGECGLDFTCLKFSKMFQIKILEMQISVAIETRKPLYLFENNAFDEMIFILEKYDVAGLWKCEKVIYCPKASLEQINRYLHYGFFIKVTTIIYNEKNNESSNIIKNIPLRRIVTATNSPFDSPSKHSRNIPINLSYVISKLSVIFGKSVDEIIAITKDNSKRLFQVNIVYENKAIIRESFDMYINNISQTKKDKFNTTKKKFDQYPGKKWQKSLQL